MFRELTIFCLADV